MNAAIVECAEEKTLDELLTGGLLPFVVRRLGPTVVQVDHQRLTEIRRLFDRLGQTPRITRE
jgi:hypothetical protein